MSDFIIGHVTDPKEGPLDGVYAETKGTYTKFKGTGAFQKEKRILHQKVADVGIKASLQTGMVSINDRNRNQAMAVIRIPATATVEAGKQYISEEKYKKLSDEEAERYWTIQKGAYIVRGQYVVAGQWLFDTFSFRQGIILKETIEELAKLRQHDEDFVTVTEYADNTIRGTDRTKHWRIGGA